MKSKITILAILAVTILALGLRLRAVDQLPVDYDEDDYLGAAQRYAAFIRQGDLQGLVDYDYNYEHPPFTKLVYGLVILPLSEAPLIPEKPPSASPAARLPQPHFTLARLSSVLFGALEVFALAIINPLAGLFLAIFTWQIKYTSQIMLEPLPALTSLLSVLFYYRARLSGALPGLGRRESDGSLQSRQAILWLALSALALGITAAGKYTYAVVGIAILVDWLWAGFQNARASHAIDSPRSGFSRLIPYVKVLGMIFAWGVLALLAFWAFNPRLWSQPLPRLAESIFFHGDYATSDYVQRVGFPAWQVLVWLAGPVPWHPGVFLFLLDLYISLLAVFGLPRLWRKNRVFALWLLIALVFLLLWPTKWPQYVLILTAPLSLSAAEGFRVLVWEPFTSWLRARSDRSARPVSSDGLAERRLSRRLAWRDARRAWLWLLPGVVTLTLIAFYPLVYQSAMSLTDFNAISIRDGIQGGVWRAVRQGLSGQVEAIPFDPMEGSRSKVVSYTGPSTLLRLLGGAVPDILVFNLIWTVLSVVLQTLLGLAVALVLHCPGVRFAGFWRALFILPWAVPEFVGALVWLRMLEPRYGWLAVAQNLPAGVITADFLDSPEKTLALLLVAATWYGFPFMMLAATAALKLVPVEVYDAAAMDGAAGWRQFRYVTWPLLLPLLAPAILIRAIFAFNQFYLFYTMRVEFPTITFATLSFYIFSPAFGGQFAFSAAINMFTVLALVALILWFNRVSKAAEGVTYA